MYYRACFILEYIIHGVYFNNIMLGYQMSPRLSEKWGLITATTPPWGQFSLNHISVMFGDCRGASMMMRDISPLMLIVWPGKTYLEWIFFVKGNKYFCLFKCYPNDQICIIIKSIIITWCFLIHNILKNYFCYRNYYLIFIDYPVCF